VPSTFRAPHNGYGRRLAEIVTPAGRRSAMPVTLTTVEPNMDYGPHVKKLDLRFSRSFAWAATA
jgi:hypothetical protein